MQLVSVVIFAALSTSSMAFNFTNPFTGSNTDSPTVQCASALTPPASLTNCSSAFGDLLSTNSSDSGLQMINSTIPTLCATLQSCNQTAYTDYANNINSSCQDILQSNPSGAIADIYYSALFCTKNSSGGYCLSDIYGDLANTQNAAASINNITTLPANLLCTQCAESMIDNLNSFVSVKHKLEYVSLSQRSGIMLTQMYHQQQSNVNQWLKNMTPSIDVGQLDASYHNKCASVNSAAQGSLPQLSTDATILILTFLSAFFLSIGQLSAF